MNCCDEDGNMVNLSSWNVCSYCKDDDYIVDEIPHTHWAYRLFKTKNRDEMKTMIFSKEKDFDKKNQYLTEIKPADMMATVRYRMQAVFKEMVSDG